MLALAHCFHTSFAIVIFSAILWSCVEGEFFIEKDGQIIGYPNLIKSRVSEPEGRLFKLPFLSGLNLFQPAQRIPNCVYNKTEGVCQNWLQCNMLSGTYNSYCQGGTSRVCCHFLRTCGQRSAQRIAYFSNEDFQSSVSGRAAAVASFANCDFRVIRRNEDVCGISLLPQVEEEDIIDQLADAGAYANPSQKLCTNHLQIQGLRQPMELKFCKHRQVQFRNKKFTLEFPKDISEVTLSLVAPTQRSVSRVVVKVEQIDCEFYNGEDLEGTVVTIPGPASDSESGEVTTEETTEETTVVTATTAITTTTVVTATPTSTTSVIPVTETATTTVSPTLITTMTITSVHTSITTLVTTTTHSIGPTITPTTTTFPTITTDVIDHSRCGAINRARNMEDVIDSLKNSLKEEEETYYTHSNQMVPEGRQNPNRQRLRWEVPDNSQSIFYYLSGPESLLTNRIVFGEESKRCERFYQAAMLRGNSFLCGATIISDRWIVTAAHCCTRYEKNFRSVRFKVGAHSLESYDRGSQELTVNKMIIHSDYSMSSLRNDIALVKLNERIIFTPCIKPVCLPAQGAGPSQDTLATVSGWGKTDRTNLSDRLRELQALVVDSRTCDKAWSSGGDFITNKMMCLSAQFGDSCNGDSGGPCVTEEHGKYVLHGIVSFGSGSCKVENLPGVYTKVAEYVDWIRFTTGSN